MIKLLGQAVNTGFESYMTATFADHHYGRAVIMFGVPYVYTQSRILKVTFKYLYTIEVLNFEYALDIQPIVKQIFQHSIYKNGSLDWQSV